MISMGKRSQRRIERYEKDQLGCMWSLINIFDFRRGGSFQKTISDRSRRSRHFGAGASASKRKMLTDVEEGQDSDDHKKSMKGRDDAGKPSVKKLIEEEMFSETEPESVQNNPQITNRIHQRSNDSNDIKKLGSEDVLIQDINAVMDEVYAWIQKDFTQTEHSPQSEVQIQKYSDFQEKLIEATKVFITEKFVSKKNLKGDGNVHHSKELMDALQTIIANKELFMELLDDPNSVLIQHIQTLQESMSEKDEKKSEEFVNNHKHHYYFFGRKIKSAQRKENGNSQDSNRIVVLKPEPVQVCKEIVKHNGFDGRSYSQFSLKEIKRKWKYVMGKDQPVISTDALLHRFPLVSPNSGHGDKKAAVENTGRKSPSRNLYTERYPKISMESETDSPSKKTVPNIYIEAKKHLSEMLSNRGDEKEDLSSKMVSKTLGRILSFPEYNFSPLYSPRMDNKQDMSLPSSSPLRENSETKFYVVNETNDDKVEGPNPNTDNSDKLISDDQVEKDTISSEVGMDAIRIIGISEESEALDTEPSSLPITKDDHNNDTSEIYDEPEPFEEIQPISSPLTSPSVSPIASKVKQKETEINPTDRPSPISVLEPLYVDEDESPRRTIYPFADLPITPLRIQFEDDNLSSKDQDSQKKISIEEDLNSIFEYCETVLRASNISWDELSAKSLSSDQLLDHSLFDNVVFFPNQLCHDPKLLFHCINEVLMEIRAYYFGFSPWMSFVNPSARPVPNNERTIIEVCEGIEWHFTPYLPPHSLEQIVTKDLVKKGKWMDLRDDTESIGVEMSEDILDDIMDDTLLSCIEHNMESDFS